MADSKLRLQIVTALDNAGIKATQDQLDSLEQTLKKTGKSGADGFDSLEKSLMKLPGPLGKIASGFGAISKAGGAIFAVISVFKEAYDIGEKIREWAGETFDWAKSFDQVQTQIQKTEQILEEAHKGEIEAAKFVANKKAEIADKEDARYEKSIQNIDNQTKALFRQVNALQSIKDAQGNEQILKLERMKFDEASQYRLNGNDEAADQLEKAYDIRIKELKLKQQIEKYDEESAKLTKSKNQDEEKFLKVMDNVRAAELRMIAEREKLSKMTTRDERYLEQKKVVERAENRFERLHNKSYDLGLKLSENAADDEKRAIERANIENQGNLEIDRAIQHLNVARIKQQNNTSKLLKQQQEALDSYNESLSDLEHSYNKSKQDINKKRIKIEEDYSTNYDELLDDLNNDKISQEEFDKKSAKLNKGYYDSIQQLIEQESETDSSINKRFQQLNKSYYKQYDNFVETYDKASLQPTEATLDSILNGINVKVDDTRTNKIIEMLDQLLQIKGQ